MPAYTPFYEESFLAFCQSNRTVGSSPQQYVSDGVLVYLDILIKSIDFVMVSDRFILELGIDVVRHSLGLSLVLLQVDLGRLVGHP